MAEFRTIKMSFWSDPYVEKLPAEGKLLYLYIISCQNMNNLGVLETSAGRISFETGIARETVEHVLRILERDGKIVREGDWLWLASFIANQCSTSPRLVQSLRSLWERIPSEKIRRAAAERYPHILAGEAQEEDGEAPCDGEDGEAEDTDVEATAADLDAAHDYPEDTVTHGPGRCGTVCAGSAEQEREQEREHGTRKKKSRRAGRDGQAKKSFGAFGKVRLSAGEMDRLCQRFGEEGAMQRIDSLDGYIASRGDKYKSHYATILNWERMDAQRNAAAGMTAAPLRGVAEGVQGAFAAGGGTAGRASALQAHNDAVCRQLARELGGGS